MVQPIELERDLRRHGVEPDKLREALMLVKRHQTYLSMRGFNAETIALAFTVQALKLLGKDRTIPLRALRRLARDLSHTPF